MIVSVIFQPELTFILLSCLRIIAYVPNNSILMLYERFPCAKVFCYDDANKLAAVLIQSYFKNTNKVFSFSEE